MSGTISTADRPVYELTAGELIVVGGQVVRVEGVHRDDEVEGVAHVQHTGSDVPLVVALTDCVAVVVGW